MTMSEGERVELGALIRTRRERKFGTKKAAYQAAEVNAATWDKAEAGESVRGDLLRRIVRELWPETEGDWTAIGQDYPTREAERLAQIEARLAAAEEKLAEYFRESDAAPQDEKSENHNETA